MEEQRRKDNYGDGPLFYYAGTYCPGMDGTFNIFNPYRKVKTKPLKEGDFILMSQFRKRRYMGELIHFRHNPSIIYEWPLDEILCAFKIKKIKK